MRERATEATSRRSNGADGHRLAVIRETLAAVFVADGGHGGDVLCNDSGVAEVARVLGVPYRRVAEMIVGLGVPRRALLRKASLDEYGAET